MLDLFFIYFYRIFTFKVRTKHAETDRIVSVVSVPEICRKSCLQLVVFGNVRRVFLFEVHPYVFIYDNR